MDDDDDDYGQNHSYRIAHFIWLYSSSQCSQFFVAFFLLFLTCSFFLFSTFRFIVGLAFFTPPFVIKYGNWYNDRFDFVWSTFCPESIHLIPLNVIYHLYCMCISAIFFSRKELPIDSPKLPPHSHTQTHIYRCIIHIYIYIDTRNGVLLFTSIE